MPPRTALWSRRSPELGDQAHHGLEMTMDSQMHNPGNAASRPLDHLDEGRPKVIQSAATVVSHSCEAISHIGLEATSGKV